MVPNSTNQFVRIVECRTSLCDGSFTMNHQPFDKSDKLKGVCYDIRGPVLDEANRMEEDGQRIIKLNTGNPKPFGFDAPEEVLQDVIANLGESTGYSHSKGIFPARKAIMQYCQTKNIKGVTVNDIFIGNGVSELIVMVAQALLNDGDEVLLPAPDYPYGRQQLLWQAANPCIIFVMKKKAGSQTLMIFAANYQSHASLANY